MISPETRQLLDYAEESHQAAKVLMDGGFTGFAAAQSYYTMFYLAEALLLSKGLHYSSHSAVIAAFGKEFAKTGLLDSKFHRYLIDAENAVKMDIMQVGENYQEKTYLSLMSGQGSLRTV